MISCQVKSLACVRLECLIIEVGKVFIIDYQCYIVVLNVNYEVSKVSLQDLTEGLVD